MIDDKKYVKIVSSSNSASSATTTETSIINQDITVTANGVYQAESGYTGLGIVTVAVPEPTRFNLTVGQLGGEINAQGELEYVGTCTPTFSGITSIGANILNYKFFNRTDIVGNIDFSDLTTVGARALYYTFSGCTGITGADFSKLSSLDASSLYFTFQDCTGLTSADITSIKNVSDRGLSNTFNGCTNLVNVDVSNIESIANPYGMYQTFSGCRSLTVLRFTKLSVLTGNLALNSCCYNCSNLTDVYFNALTSSSFGTNNNQFKTFIGGVTGCTLHFPSNLDPESGSTTISGLNGYPLFGGTNTVLAFDLPATE